MRLEQKDLEYLRNLAMQVYDIALDEQWDEKRTLWIKKNSLIKTRPLIMCALPVAAWREIITEKDLKIQDPVFRTYELELLKTIYRYHNLHDDIILNNKLYIPVKYTVIDWYEGRKRPFSADGKSAECFHPSIIEYDDFKKIGRPEIVDIDYKDTYLRYEEAKAVFGDLLDIEIGIPFHANTDHAVFGSGNSILDIFIELRGYENVLEDVYEEPEWIHEVMSYMCECYEHYYDQLEEYHLLRYNSNEFIMGADTCINSNGLTLTKELPAAGCDPTDVKTQDLWGYSEAQEFTVVSPEMLEEFVLPYQGRIARWFGLNGYGCCENMHGKYEMIKKYIPNLKEFSITYTCDQEEAVEHVKDEYVYSWKPRTTDLITVYNEERIRDIMKTGFEITKDCHVVASLRDTQTLYGEPERIAKWCDISMELAKGYE